VGDKVAADQQNLCDQNYFQIPLLLRFESPLLKNKAKEKPSKLIGMAEFWRLCSIASRCMDKPTNIGC
jgi:hypothetical protein